MGLDDISFDKEGKEADAALLTELAKQEIHFNEKFASTLADTNFSSFPNAVTKKADAALVAELAKDEKFVSAKAEQNKKIEKLIQHKIDGCPEILPPEEPVDPDKPFFDYLTDNHSLTMDKSEAKDLFVKLARKLMSTVDVDMLPFIDDYAGFNIKDSEGIMPDVISLKKASLSELAKFANRCRRIEMEFKRIMETAKSNKHAALLQAGMELEEDELAEFTLSLGGIASCSIKRGGGMFVSVLNAERLLGWLLMNGHGGIIKRDIVDARTLASLIKTIAEEKGGFPPEDIVKSTPDRAAKISLKKTDENVW